MLAEEARVKLPGMEWALELFPSVPVKLPVPPVHDKDRHTPVVQVTVPAPELESNRTVSEAVGATPAVAPPELKDQLAVLADVQVAEPPIQKYVAILFI